MAVRLTRDKLSLRELLSLAAELSASQAAALSAELFASEGASLYSEQWTAGDVLETKRVLLDDLRRLASPDTKLVDKLDLLSWVYSDEANPFSFSECLKAMYGYSASFPQFGKLSAESVREEMEPLVWKWLNESVEQLPQWVQSAFAGSPENAVRLLFRNERAMDEASLDRVSDAVKEEVDPSIAIALLARSQKRVHRVVRPAPEQVALF